MARSTLIALALLVLCTLAVGQKFEIINGQKEIQVAKDALAKAGNYKTFLRLLQASGKSRWHVTTTDWHCSWNCWSLRSLSPRLWILPERTVPEMVSKSLFLLQASRLSLLAISSPNPSPSSCPPTQLSPTFPSALSLSCPAQSLWRWWSTRCCCTSSPWASCDMPSPAACSRPCTAYTWWSRTPLCRTPSCSLPPVPCFPQRWPSWRTATSLSLSSSSSHFTASTTCCFLPMCSTEEWLNGCWTSRLKLSLCPSRLLFRYHCSIYARCSLDSHLAWSALSAVKVPHTFREHQRSACIPRPGQPMYSVQCNPSYLFFTEVFLLDLPCV